MDSRVVVNIFNIFQRLYLHYKFLNLTPDDGCDAKNKQKVCTKAWNVTIFHKDYMGFSKRLQNPCFEPLFER